MPKGKGCLIPIIAVVAIVVILGIIMISNYNKFVNAETEVDEKFSVIETDLQRRYDLIPNLVNTVKGFAKQEKDVIKSVTDARASLGGARTNQEKAEANEQLQGALSRLLVVVENYPTLKSDAHFKQLMDELAGTENRIAVSRKDYNTVVANYNKMIRRFPGSLMAGILGFDKKEYFQTTTESRNNPEVDFSDEDKSTSFNFNNNPKLTLLSSGKSA
ncbi:LemA protein [Paenibacillus shirakamiensis]|uniref:LemA protein n=1 Tax=Paenibacillus shirakamiensis TaxID=1265935 RepID=A0ABS4JIK8_9BACL|nr:LemA family protein [Paenibacillus shirakamiensis]MBP2001543.1 LemA protein [Paenibacillus shirakamiensis]